VTARTAFEYQSPIAFQFEVPELEVDAFDWTGPDESGSAAPERDERDSPSDLGYFLNLAGRFPLLTAEEERRLGSTIWHGRVSLLRILRRGRRSKRRSGAPAIPLDPPPANRPLSAASRRRLARVEKLARAVAARRGSRYVLRLERTLAEIDSARSELVERNLRLVAWVAKNFRRRGLDFIDLIQEGSVGLMRAADRYDPRVGARFSTFATHWIAQGIRRAIAEKARIIRIPVNRIPEAQQALRCRAALSAKLGRLARPEEIAREMGVPTAKLEELLPALGSIESIDAPVPGTERRLSDILEDRAPKPLDCAIEEETRRAVRAVLHELPPRQRIILSMRHGIGYPKECTLDEIGDALGLSRERIRQVERVAATAVKERIQEQRPELVSLEAPSRSGGGTRRPGSAGSAGALRPSFPPRQPVPGARRGSVPRPAR
jgi:RNA polymerase primary sigma factor